jgi:hypothetical protein
MQHLSRLCSYLLSVDLLMATAPLNKDSTGGAQVANGNAQELNAALSWG